MRYIAIASCEHMKAFEWFHFGPEEQTFVYVLCVFISAGAHCHFPNKKQTNCMGTVVAIMILANCKEGTIAHDKIVNGVVVSTPASTQ